MRIYADTSVLLAWFHPADQFAQAVTEWCRERSPEFSWNHFLRAELRHNLHRLSGAYSGIAWHAYRMSETSGRLRLELDRVSNVLEWADALSARCASACSAGTWDCVHVAAAQHSGVQVFLTCDAAQAELARLAGFPDVHLLVLGA